MKNLLPVSVPLKAKIVRVNVPSIGYRWRGSIEVSYKDQRIVLLMPGNIAHWLNEGEEVEVVLVSEPEPVGDVLVASYNDYELYRLWDGRVKVWPPWKKKYTLPRYSLLRGDVIYEYSIIAREAITEQDYMEIAGLEQYHYASKEEIVAVWRCPVCGAYFESNLQPKCPQHKIPARLHEIRGSLPSSRFLVLELVDKKPFEPRIVGYVRVDTPIPLMNRLVKINGREYIEKAIREKVFPREWFHPTFWPRVYSRRLEIIKRYRELAKLYRSRMIARSIVGDEISKEALRNANTAAARIARVVVHPDYRGDGIGVLAVKAVVEWIAERRVPEMKKRKHVVETIAQMARYNPFFEKAGFKYMWDTASGRPVLMYPLSREAEERINSFLEKDSVAQLHKGRLYKPRYKSSEPLNGRIVVNNLSKTYSSVLDISRLPENLQDVLRAFGVERRVVERYVLKDVNLSIESGEIVAVVGASGAGKTTFLRMIVGAALGINDERYRPTSGSVSLPSNTRIEYLLPGEHEPEFGEETLLEHMTAKLGDAAAAVEVLNSVGLSDAVFYRARYSELSTGQKERARLASMLASRPNLIIIDEFTAHLDALTAQRVARKLAAMARKNKITLIIATNRPETLRALEPDKMIFIGYGTATIGEYKELSV